jgi:hypothetical protein
MDEQDVTQIILQRPRFSSSYSEREAAASSSVGIATIRHLHALGLIEGIEVIGRRDGQHAGAERRR